MSERSEAKKATKELNKQIKQTLKEQKRTRYWRVPKDRAKTYADELKARVHNHGKKEGKSLTSSEICLRMGYLQNQSDQAGLYKFKKARKEGKSKDEAAKISWKIGK